MVKAYRDSHTADDDHKTGSKHTHHLDKWLKNAIDLPTGVSTSFPKSCRNTSRGYHQPPAICCKLLEPE